MRRNVKKISYILASYRVDIPAGEKLEAFIKKNSRHGQYVCLIQGKKRIAFAKNKGYLFAEHLNEYKRRPRKYIYIEKNSDDNYLFVSLINGSVFYDALLSEEDQVIQQTQILMSLDQEPAELCYVGFHADSVLMQSILREWGDKLQLEERADSVSRSFKPNKTFLTHSSKAQPRSKQSRMILFLVIMVCGLVLIYLIFQMLRPKPKVFVQTIDPYAGYKKALSAPNAQWITTVLDQQYQHLLNELKGLWKISTIKFNGHSLIFNITGKSSAALVTPLFDLGKQWGMTVNYNQNIGVPNAQLLAEVAGKKSMPVGLIVPVQKQLAQYIVNLQETFGDSVKYQTAIPTTAMKYKTITVSASIGQVPMSSIIALLQQVDHYPARLQKFEITEAGNSADDFFYNLSYTIAFYGD